MSQVNIKKFIREELLIPRCSLIAGTGGLAQETQHSSGRLSQRTKKGNMERPAARAVFPSFTAKLRCAIRVDDS